DIGHEGTGQAHSLAPVGCFGDHIRIGDPVQKEFEASPDDAVVVSDENVNHALAVPIISELLSLGKRNSICVPCPGEETTRSRPRRSKSLSSMPIRPSPARLPDDASNPCPLSETLPLSSPLRTRIPISTCLAPECLAAFVRASCTTL